MFALLYKILSIFGLDHRLLLVRFEKFKDIMQKSEMVFLKM